MQHAGTQTAELYDYRKDYAELRGLVRDGSAPPEVRAELARLISAFVYEAERTLARPPVWRRSRGSVAARDFRISETLASTQR